MARLAARAIGKTYPAPGGGRTEALRDVDLTVEDGEFVCLVGPSGCGKSTLLNILAGLDEADTGEVRVESARGGRAVMRTVFQESRLLPWMTVRDNLAFVLDGSRREKDERIREWLARVGLEGTGAHYPNQLSIGMQQRVAVARGLMVEPDVLFMDEPFSALDELTAMSVREELLDLWGEIRPSILFVTHNPLEATLLADRIVVMSAGPGRIVHDERLVERLPRPRDPDDPAIYGVSREMVARLRGEGRIQRS